MKDLEILKNLKKDSKLEFFIVILAIILSFCAFLINFLKYF